MASPLSAMFQNAPLVTPSETYTGLGTTPGVTPPSSMIAPTPVPTPSFGPQVVANTSPNVGNLILPAPQENDNLAPAGTTTDLGTQIQQVPSNASGQYISSTTGYNVDPNSYINDNFTPTPSSGTAPITPGAASDALNAANGTQSSYTDPSSTDIIEQYKTDRLLHRGMFSIDPNASPQQVQAQNDAGDSYYQNLIGTVARKEYYDNIYGLGSSGSSMDVSDASKPYDANNSLDVMAEKYMQTGKLSSTQQKSIPLANAISTRADQLSQQLTGNDFNPAQTLAGNVATAFALKKQTQYLASTKAALDRADSGFSTMLSQFKDSGINQDIPVSNAIDNLYKTNTNDPNVPAFKAVLQDLSSEYAQVFAKGGALTVQDQTVAQKILSGDYSMTQLGGIAKALHTQGMSNIAGSQRSISDLYSSYKSSGTQDNSAQFFNTGSSTNTPSTTTSSSSDPWGALKY